jgi:hypothetical protein
LGLNNKLLKGREGGEGGSWKKVPKKYCNYLLGIIYKLLKGSQGDRKEVVRKKDPKSSKKSFFKSFFKTLEHKGHFLRTGFDGDFFQKNIF